MPLPVHALGLLAPENVRQFLALDRVSLADGHPLGEAAHGRALLQPLRTPGAPVVLGRRPRLPTPPPETSSMGLGPGNASGGATCVPTPHGAGGGPGVGASCCCAAGLGSINMSVPDAPGAPAPSALADGPALALAWPALLASATDCKGIVIGSLVALPRRLAVRDGALHVSRSPFIAFTRSGSALFVGSSLLMDRTLMTPDFVAIRCSSVSSARPSQIPLYQGGSARRSCWPPMRLDGGRGMYQRSVSPNNASSPCRWCLSPWRSWTCR